MVWFLTITPGLIFLAAALYRWLRLPDCRRALALTIFNLRALCAGYVLWVLTIYPATVLLVVPVDLHYEAIHREYLKTGQTAVMLREFGP